MGGSITTSVARRLAAVGVAALTAMLTGAAPPAQAITSTAGAGVDYTCEGSALLGLVPTGSVPLHLDALHPVTVPLGGLVSGLTISTGLAALVDELTGVLLRPLFTISDLSFAIAGELNVAGTVDPSGAFDLPSFSLPPGAAAGSTLPIRAPSSFVLHLAATALGSLACTLDEVGSDVVGTILVGPASTDTTVKPVEPPPAAHAGGTTTAGSRATLSARLVHPVLRRGTRARVRAIVEAAGGVPATGRVVVRGAGRRLGTARLADGAALVRLATLPVGRYRLSVRAEGLTRRLILRIVR